MREEGYVRVKLTDFEKAQARSSIFHENVGSNVWMPPEVFRAGSEDPPLIIPAKVDAYSFAMVCYEILSRESNLVFVEKLRKWRDYLWGGGRPELPAALPSRLTSLVKSC